jgi:hypothetical protein
MATATSSFTAATIAPPSPPMPSICIACHPKMANQISVNNDGANSTPMTNSRMVRPREMRATKIPMNGDHVTVHVQ